jgi:hypothetical protein
METDLDFSQLTAEERTEILKKKATRQSASPMGYIHPQKIRELLANTDLSRPAFKEYEEPIYTKVPKMPQTCPECGKSSKHYLHIKFIKLRNKCFDCIVKDETQIRLRGEWEEYEKWKIIENQLSYFKDVKDETDDYLKNGLKKQLEFVREDGHIERWDNANYEKEKIFIEDKYKQLLEFLEKLQEEITPLREKFCGNKTT